MLVKAAIRFEIGAVIDDNQIKHVQEAADAAARAALESLKAHAVSTGGLPSAYAAEVTLDTY